jgi:acyl dehydratase
VDAYLDSDVSAVRSYGARFASVVFPGEMLLARIWKEDRRLLATVIAPARDNAAVLTGVELVPARS